MTPDEPPRPRFPLARAYTILCGAALFVMALALIENGRDPLTAVVLAGLGALLVLVRFRAGPPVLLAGFIALEVAHRLLRPWAFRGQAFGLDESPAMDVVLCAAVLTSAAGMYRLLALTRTALPVDPRRPPPLTPTPLPRGERGAFGSPLPRGERGAFGSPLPPGERGRGEGRRAPPHDARRPRAATAAGQGELATLAVAAVLCAAAAFGVWLVLSATDTPAWWENAYAARSLRAARYEWRVLLLLWGVGLSAAVVGGAAAYLLWATAPPAAHRVYLHDQAWLETRRDQSRVSRFLVWARLRGQRREENQ
jgi:hypothetical protein